MSWWKIAVIALCGAGCGLISAGGFASFITWLSIVPRLADITKNVRNIRLFERCLAAGFILYNLISMFPIKLEMLTVTKTQFVLIPFALFSGIFSGCLAGALAEVLETIPILAKRLKNKNAIKYIIFAIALAKSAGSLIQLIRV